MIYLAAVLGVVWVLLFLYTFSLSSRTMRLQEEVRMIKRTLKLNA